VLNIINEESSIADTISKNNFSTWMQKQKDLFTRLIDKFYINPSRLPDLVSKLGKAFYDATNKFGHMPSLFEFIKYLKNSDILIDDNFFIENHKPINDLKLITEIWYIFKEGK
jgi:hypothetical protein